jgi:hypothetical protein
MNKKGKFGCFGCGCGCLTAIIIAIIIAILAGVFWAKRHIYYQQPEKINKVAEEICQFKLPEELEPMIAFDFNFAKFALFTFVKENRIAMAIFIEAPINEIEKSDTTLMMQAITFGLSENLNIKHPENVTVTTETMNSIVMVGTNTMQVTETKIRYEEDDVTMIVRQGTFFKGKKMVIVNFLATEGPNTSKRATQFLNSVKP